MRRLFAGMALGVVVLLVASYVTGVRATDRSRHVILGASSVLAAVLVQAAAWGALWEAERRVQAEVQAGRRPGWAAGLAERNRRRAEPFGAGSVLLIGLTAALGGAIGDGPGPAAAGHLLTASISLAFCLGASAVVLLSMAAQARLLREVVARPAEPDTGPATSLDPRDPPGATSAR